MISWGNVSMLISSRRRAAKQVWMLWLSTGAFRTIQSGNLGADHQFHFVISISSSILLCGPRFHALLQASGCLGA